MKRIVSAVLLGAAVIGMSACSSSPSSPTEVKPLEGKRIPPGAGGSAPAEKN